MAEQFRFECDKCGYAIEAWDDGNPYYFDANGRKRYAYHPDDKRAQCVGNDEERVCLGCGKQFKSDSEAPVEACPKCQSSQHVDACGLDAQPCPYCKEGTFRRDPNSSAIS